MMLHRPSETLLKLIYPERLIIDGLSNTSQPYYILFKYTGTLSIKKEYLSSWMDNGLVRKCKDFKRKFKKKTLSWC